MDNLYEETKRIQELIEPKLESLSNSGNGAIIHQCNLLLSGMRGSRHLYEAFLNDEIKNQHKIEYWLNIFHDRVLESESWLSDYGKIL